MVALVQPVIETARCTKCGDVKSCDDFGKGVYQRALKDTEGRYQILCANCNTIKAWEYNQCRLLAASKGA